MKKELLSFAFLLITSISFSQIEKSSPKITNETRVQEAFEVKRQINNPDLLKFDNFKSEKTTIDFSRILTFNLYPNPSKSEILNISQVESGTYRIINVVGQEVSKGKIEGESIPVHMIKSGAYLLEVTSNGEVALKRFIKE